jgi:hypothetical protein
MMLARNSLVASHPGPSQRPSAGRLLLSSVVICVASAVAVFTTLFLREGTTFRPPAPTQIAVARHPASNKPTLAPAPANAAPAPADANVSENAVPAAEPTPDDNPADLVARTHSELKALEHTSDRRFTEFSLTRSKRLRRFGSVKIQLRKTDPRNHTAQVSIWAGNASLGEKHAVLYGPIEIPSSKSSGPAFLVLNQISARRVSGYLTEPASASDPARNASVRDSPHRSRAH